MDIQLFPISPWDVNPELSSNESIPGSGSGSGLGSDSPVEAVFGPEAKKQKTEEVGGSADDDEVADDDSSGSDEDEPVAYNPPLKKGLVLYPEDKEGQEKFKRYYEIIRESEGFDVGELPPVEAFMGGVFPVDCERMRKNVDDCVDHVIREHNEEKKGVSQLQLVNIEKANWGRCAGENYYITFDAVDLLSFDPNAKRTYQAEVYRDIHDSLSTTLFREKGQKGSIREMEDRPVTYM